MKCSVNTSLYRTSLKTSIKQLNLPSVKRKKFISETLFVKVPSDYTKFESRKIRIHCYDIKYLNLF